ncbi:heat shock protein Hsp20 [Clostridium amylolyticum]|uniref:Heat shock protein Hsp20 n=1 Tax=Clostridium amylolyticum TaxID=1121298 RepID=A0A1M6NK86_9CLOT|nr:heat shock protein Hsp18 [Clostridium amylolyticum]SHJ96004.1 heat shock protein Hsp20 [Clostridium amylolyticum]
MFEMIPWRRNSNMQRRDDLFETMVNSFFSDDFFTPASLLKSNFSVDLKETENEYVVEADLPGVDKENIHIDYNKGYLNISAKRDNLVEDKKDNYVRQERSYGEFKRCFYVDNVDEEKIQASFENGVLNVKLPKVSKEKQSGRKIDIN